MSTRKPKSEGLSPRVIQVPRELINHHRNVRLHIDVTCVNKIPFLHAISEHVSFSTSSYLKVETKTSLLEAIEKITHVHKDDVFKVNYIEAGLQFECVEDSAEGVTFEIVDTDDQVHPKERSIRTAKEGVRCLVA